MSEMKKHFARVMRDIEADAAANREKLLMGVPGYGRKTNEDACLQYARDIHARMKSTPSFEIANGNITYFVIVRQISGLSYAPFVDILTEGRLKQETMDRLLVNDDEAKDAFIDSLCMVSFDHAARIARGASPFRSTSRRNNPRRSKTRRLPRPH